MGVQMGIGGLWNVGQDVQQLREQCSCVPLQKNLQQEFSTNRFRCGHLVWMQWSNIIKYMLDNIAMTRQRQADKRLVLLQRSSRVAESDRSSVDSVTERATSKLD